MSHQKLPTTEDLRGHIQHVDRRIADACARVGRSPAEVSLVAVTKTFPPDVVEAAIAAGLTAFGENRVQELVAKSDAIPGKAMGGEITWHQVGPVQRNKAKDVAQRADVFHALDSIRLAKRLNRLVGEAGRKLPC
ncbi:MAG: YggS family pyridoxal phosphate enzyme, partial [Rubricoccaceae bacterium]|nr:YggS family pyridoxal phosphate enzyme [Rubricoccaceae bacterium]